MPIFDSKNNKRIGAIAIIIIILLLVILYYHYEGFVDTQSSTIKSGTLIDISNNILTPNQAKSNYNQINNSKLLQTITLIDNILCVIDSNNKKITFILIDTHNDFKVVSLLLDGPFITIAANNKSLWAINDKLSGFYVTTRQLDENIIIDPSTNILTGLNTKLNPINDMMYSMCVTKNSAWCCGTDYIPYYHLIDNSGNAIDVWKKFGTKFDGPLKYLSCDRNGEANSVWAIDKNDKICYLTLNENGSPPESGIWQILSDTPQSSIFEIYNNILCLIDLSGNVQYLNMNNLNINNKKQEFTKLSNINKIKFISLNFNTLFCVSDDNKLYLCRIVNVGIPNVDDSPKIAQLNLNNTSLTYFMTLSKSVAQIVAGIDKLYILYTDGTLQCIILYKITSDYQEEYNQQINVINSPQYIPSNPTLSNQQIKSDLRDNFCMSVDPNNNFAYMTDCINNINQKFTLDNNNHLSVGDGSYCLDVSNNQIVQTLCRDSGTQWEIDDKNRIRQKGLNSCLNINAGSQDNGARIITYPCTSDPNNTWTFLEPILTKAPLNYRPTPTEGGQSIPSTPTLSNQQIKSNLRDNFCMSVDPNNNYTYMADCSNNINQKFTLDNNNRLSVGDGLYCLDVSNNQIVQTPCRDSGTQWEIDDKNRIRQKGLNSCLNINAGSQDNGARIITYPCTSDPNNTWTFLEQIPLLTEEIKPEIKLIQDNLIVTRAKGEAEEVKAEIKPEQEQEKKLVLVKASSVAQATPTTLAMPTTSTSPTTPATSTTSTSHSYKLALGLVFLIGLPILIIIIMTIYIKIKKKLKIKD
jgi:hypothetical protein